MAATRRAVQAGRSKSAGGRVRFTEAARAAAVAVVERRREAGGSVLATARELGVEYQTLRRWMARVKPAFRRVSLASTTQAPPARLVLTLPSGLQVEGLDIDGVAELVRRLS